MKIIFNITRGRKADPLGSFLYLTGYDLEIGLIMAEIKEEYHFG